jgi:hypothetical protein
MGATAGRTYSYFVVLFELSTIGMFIYLYFYNVYGAEEVQVDPGCYSTPIEVWWYVSFALTILGSLVGALVIFAKFFIERNRRWQRYTEDIRYNKFIDENHNNVSDRFLLSFHA